MYIRTKEGLGQEQATWSTFQTFRRPPGRSTLTGGFEHVNERMGQAESKPCWDCYKTAPCWVRFKVENFKPGSAELTNVIKKDVEDIATAIVRILHRILKSKSTDLKKRKTSLALMLQLEGHLSKATDPQNTSLDLDRANAVAEYLSTQIGNEWSFQGLDKLQNGLGMNLTPSAAGSRRPASSKARRNRRVEVCVQPYIPTRAGMSLLTPP